MSVIEIVLMSDIVPFFEKHANWDKAEVGRGIGQRAVEVEQNCLHYSGIRHEVDLGFLAKNSLDRKIAIAAVFDFSTKGSNRPVAVSRTQLVEWRLDLPKPPPFSFKDYRMGWSPSLLPQEHAYRSS